MKLSSIRSLRLIAFVVALLLVGLAFYPGMLASPYEPLPHQYSHAVTPESSESFEQHTEEFDPPVREYDSLSPVGQDLFDRTRAEPAHRNSDWHRYTPNICRPEMIVCDGVHVDDLPTEFTYGEDLEPSETSTIIVDGDDRYLLRTGDTSHADGFVDIDVILVLVTLLPLGLFVAVVAAAPTLSRREHRLAALAAGGGGGLLVFGVVTISIQTVLLGIAGVVLGGSLGVPSSDRTLAGLSLAGVTVAALGLLTPYIVMFTSISVGNIGMPLLIAIWLGFAIAAGYTIYTDLTRTRGLG